MEPLVSILIPAFNAERWIADTINSALGQTWQRKEVIIVDDGSTDQTLSIARQSVSKGVTVVTQKNQGASAARNKAYSLSRGGYIQWLDADDLLAPDKIGRQMHALDRGGSTRTLLSSAWGHFMYRPSAAVFTPTSLWGDLSPVEWLLRKLEQSLFMDSATWLVSRELTEAAGPWDTRLSLDDDGEYFCRVILASEGTRFVPEARAYYRQSGFGSLSNVGRTNKNLESQLLSIQLHIRYLRSLEDSERVRSACLKYLQTWLVYFYPDKLDLARQLELLAAECGGRLEGPRLPWKYAWIRKAFGWSAAKRSQHLCNDVKLSVRRSWDKALFQLGL
jgi:glycosyltransferase involved in cell wall biosynthesis